MKCATYTALWRHEQLTSVRGRHQLQNITQCFDGTSQHIHIHIHYSCHSFCVGGVPGCHFNVESFETGDPGCGEC